MKTAFITGISRGIGKALAQKFLKEGHNVFGTSQTGASDLSDKNLKVFQLDLTSADSIKACADQIAKTGSKIDFYINNSGTLEDESETRVVIEKLRKTLEVNLIGTIDMTERLLPAMNKSSHIVNIASQAGSLSDMDNIEDSHEPYHYPAYKISKAALNMYTRTLAARLHHEGSGIIVSSVHPGWVRTAMGGDEAPITPEEAASDIFVLATSRPVTGQFWYKGNRFPW
jgi:NAD(P)-dependent dehydrogenase (short-subunit alcohol dehydrogenase family)